MDLIAWTFAGAVLLTLVAVVAWALGSQPSLDAPAIMDMDPWLVDTKGMPLDEAAFGEAIVRAEDERAAA